MITVNATTPNHVREEDARLCGVTRDGRQIRRHWNQLSRAEPEPQREADRLEAERRACYVALFNPCGLC